MLTRMHADVHGSYTFICSLFFPVLSHAHKMRTPTQQHAQRLSCMWLRVPVCSVLALSGGRWWLLEGTPTWRQSPCSFNTILSICNMTQLSKKRPDQCDSEWDTEMKCGGLWQKKRGGVIRNERTTEERMKQKAVICWTWCTFHRD